MSDSEKNFSDSSDESSKPGLLTKKKKKSEKPGYRMFDADDSDDAPPVVYDDTAARATSTKLKKHSRPSFKFSGKIKLKEKEKDDKKDIGDKKDEKEPRKIHIKKFKDKDAKDKDKDSKEHKLRKKKDKSYHTFRRKTPLTAVPSITTEAEWPVFGVALSLAVERTPSHDGVKLPVIVRECVDYIEEHGLLYEGIYRISGVKSKVQMLKDAYNRQQPAYLFEHDPSIVASLLKQFLRELPESLLTTDLAVKFEEASVIQNSKERLERLEHCIYNLPPCNKELLSWMIVHMNHVIAKEKINKMSLQNVSIVLSPTMRISHRVLNVLFMHSYQLFSDVKISRYRPPLPSAASKWSVDLPETSEAIEEELHKQESLLSKLHQELSHHQLSEDSEKEDRVWEVQRTVTQLKRKLKVISKTTAARQLEKQQLSSDSLPVKRTDPHRRSINAAELNFALQTGSLRRANQSSQAELASASSCPSFTASNEAISGQHKHNVEVNIEVISNRSGQSQRTSVSLEKTSQGGDEGAPCKPPTDLDLSTVQSDTTELSSEFDDDTPLSPSAATLPGADESTDDNQVADEDEIISVEVVPTSTVPEEIIAKLSGDQQQTGEDQLNDLIENVGIMKVSTSQDSDVTLSPYTSAGVTGSISQQSLSEYKQLTTDISSAANEDSDQVSNQQPQQEDHEEPSVADDDVASQSAVTDVQPTQSQRIDQASDLPKDTVSGSSAMLLIPEKLHTGSSSPNANFMSKSSDHVYNIADDDELRLLIAEEAQLIWEEEELIAIKDELRQKIDTEIIEIERLREEITEYEELRSITTLGHSSEAMSSDEYYSSTSDTEPEDDEAAEAELNNLVMTLHELNQKNEECEAETAEMVKKIHEERMGCVNVKIQIRLLQQQLLFSQTEEQSLI